MDKKEIIHLLTSEAPESLKARAQATLAESKGRRVFVRGLIEISNVCLRNCVYCGLRAPNRDLKRYRLSRAQIVEAASAAVADGADSIVLQGGEGFCDPEWLGAVVSAVKEATGVPITLSVGEAPHRDYELWRRAGADRYLLKHETASPEFYARLHPGYSLQNRLDCLRDLQSLGYEIGTGFMVGLPGQTTSMLADDILLSRELGASMVGAGPFLAHQATPLAHANSGSYELSLRVLAVLRIIMPNANLPATTALASVDGSDGQVAGLTFGANVLMPNYTPSEQAQNFRIYDQKRRVGMEEALMAIRNSGRVFEPGNKGE